MMPWDIQLAGLVQYRSGQPWNVVTGRDNNLDANEGTIDRPDLAVPGGDPRDRATYFADFTNRVGNLGRNTFEGPGLNWTQLSLAKWWKIRERGRFELRLDGNNFPFMQPNFGNPGATYNVNSASTFGRGPGGRGSFSDVGTANGHMLIVGRFQF